jgi:hypothetical protein
MFQHGPDDNKMVLIASHHGVVVIQRHQLKNLLTSLIDATHSVLLKVASCLYCAATKSPGRGDTSGSIKTSVTWAELRSIESPSISKEGPVRGIVFAELNGKAVARLIWAHDLFTGPAYLWR